MAENLAKQWCQLVVLSLIIFQFYFSKADFTICTPCAENAEWLEEGKDNPICEPFKTGTNGLFDTDLDCKNLQLEAYQSGCCPNPPFEHCEFCKDGSSPDLDLVIPTGRFVGGQPCYEYIYQNEAYLGLFEDGTCDDTFLQRAGHYCGCPNQEQECWLCPDGQPPSKPAKGDAWITDSTCRGIEYFFSLMTKEECASFPILAGADLAIFCGCGGLNQTEIDAQAESYTCSLCRNGGRLKDPNQVYFTDGQFVKTCGQAEKFAREIIKSPAGCKNQRYFGDAWEQCECTTATISGSSHSIAIRPWIVLLSGMTILVGLV